MAITAPASAQQSAAVLVGKVVDAVSKKGLADVVVTVTSSALQGEQIVTTDNTGTYRIPSLPPGVYTLHLDKEGYRAFQRDQIPLRADATIRLDADLLSETANLQAAEVVVVAHSPTIDVGSTSSGASINSDFVSRIPITNPGAHGGAQRTFESVAEAAPGASADLFGTSINGATSPENSYVIDGMRTNSSRYGTNGSPLTVEFVKEVNVLSSGYMPEYGKSTGGILNVITKSGSNEYHGNVWANWTPGAIEGNRKYPYFTGTAIQTRRSLANVYDIGFDQSGPIVKDKLWYYVGFDVSRAIYNLDRSIYMNDLDGTGKVTGTHEIAGTNKQYQASATSYQIFARLDYTLNQNNKFQLSFAATPTTSGGNGDFAVDPQSGKIEVVGGGGAEFNINGTYFARATKRRSGAYDTVLKWTTEFDNKSKNLETTFGWHHELGGTESPDGFRVDSGLGYTNQPYVTWRRNPYHSINDFENVPGCDPAGTASAVLCPVTDYRSGGRGFLDEEIVDVYALRSTLTVLGQFLGHHVIKAGFEGELDTSWNTRGTSGGWSYQETTAGDGFDVVGGYGYMTAPDTPVAIDRSTTRTYSFAVGGFVQDSWALFDKVTLNVGLRYDNQFVYGADGKLFLSLPNQISPRIGIIYDPTQSGRSKIFASYAKFYESIPLDIVDRGTGGEPGLQYSVGYVDSGCDPRSIQQANTVCRTTGVAKGPVNGGAFGAGDRKYLPYAGGKSSIDPDLSPQSLSEFSAGAEYELFKNGRIGATYTRRWMNQVIEDMSNDEAATFFIGNPGKGIASGFPEAERNYDAGTVYLTKTFADDWQAQISYTLSWLRGNIGGLYKAETGQLDPNANATFDLKSLLVNQSGDLPGDHRHNIRAYGSKDFKITKESIAQLGASVTATSGGPTDYLGAHAFYGADEVYILPRGSGDRLPWNGNFSPHVGYTYRFQSGMSLAFTVDIFNLLNLQEALATDQRYTRSNVFPIADGSPSDLPSNGGNKLISTRTGTPIPATQVWPNFGHVTAYQEPRQFRFGIRGSF